MMNPSASPLTALSTGREEPIILVAMSLERSGRHYRLKVAGAPLEGSCEVHEWRFDSGDLSPAVLNEVGAIMDSLSTSSLLMALGMTHELSFELHRAAEQV
jgi:hypothetical protein